MKWEYCRIEILDNRKELKFSTALFFIGKDDAIKDINIPKKIRDLGLDRWELVSHTKILYPENVIEEMLYFKRPIQEEIPIYGDGVKLDFPYKKAYDD